MTTYVRKLIPTVHKTCAIETHASTVDIAIVCDGWFCVYWQSRPYGYYIMIEHGLHLINHTCLVISKVFVLTCSMCMLP